MLDTTVFLEYLPSNKQWLLTLMACWWGLGQLIAGLWAWAFLPTYHCPDVNNCTKASNMGWRYVWFANGALVLVFSILRITVIRLKETPKYLVGEGKDEQIVEVLQGLAKRYNRPCSLTLEKMQTCNDLAEGGRANYNARANRKNWASQVLVHLRGLFATKKIALSTSLIWLSWLLIGLAYPLYNVFLPIYLQTRGAQFGEASPSITWRNYAIINFCGIPGPVVAGLMCKSKYFWGRRGTMIIGALVTMIFFFCFTQVRSASQNLGFNCAINFCLNIYYGTLYAYSPEVLPSAHRGTGNGIAIGLNRIMGILSAVIATVANTSTPVPIYICAALYIVMAGIAAIFPFEPYGSRSS